MSRCDQEMCPNWSGDGDVCDDHKYLHTPEPWETR